MTGVLDEEKIRLFKGPSLVIWELLTRTLRNPEAQKVVGQGDYEYVFKIDEAERQALHYLAGAIERAVPEVMAAEMPELIKAGRVWLTNRPK